MSDRELLGLAAKAAGLSVKWLPAKPGMRAMFWQTHVGEWNPLADDGDALRLAVKLEMELKVYDTSSHAASAFSGFSVCASEKGSPLAATRRAIVRAAAEIGRTL